MTQIGGYELVDQPPRVDPVVTDPVFKAFDGVSGRFVALREQPGLDQDKLQFDAMILGMLDHPNIARIFNTISEDGLCYLVQEWVDGTDLDSVRDHAGRLTVAQSVTVVRGALRGLAFAHNRQIVHGAVSPRNILVSTAGESKLIDFGALSPEGVVGAGYRSPEVLAGGPATKRSDVFSAAVVLADLLGVRPGRALFDLSGIDPSIAGVLNVALSDNPDIRQASGAQLLEDLESAADRSLGLGWPAVDSLSRLVTEAIDSASRPVPTSGQTSSAITAAGPTGRPGRRHGTRSRRLPAVVGAVLVVLLVLAMVAAGILVILR